MASSFILFPNCNQYWKKIIEVIFVKSSDEFVFIFILLFRIFAKVSKSITGRKLQHICGELCGVIGIEDLCKMLIMSKEP